MGSGREAQKRMYIHLQLIHIVQQKLTQHYKIIILQFEKNKNRNTSQDQFREKPGLKVFCVYCFAPLLLLLLKPWASCLYNILTLKPDCL